MLIVSAGERVLGGRQEGDALLALPDRVGLAPHVGQGHAEQRVAPRVLGRRLELLLEGGTSRVGVRPGPGHIAVDVMGLCQREPPVTYVVVKGPGREPQQQGLLLRFQHPEEIPEGGDVGRVAGGIEIPGHAGQHVAGTREVTLGEVHHSLALERLQVARPQPDGAIERRQRLRIAPEPEEGLPEHAGDRAGSGVDTLPPAQMLHRLLPATETLLRQSESAEHVSIRRGESQALGVLLDRALGIAGHPAVIVPQRYVPLRPVRCKRDGPFRRRA